MFARFMGLKTISPKELHGLLPSGQVTVIDVNSSESWKEAHVPGARNLDPVEFSNADLPPDTNATVVFYCSNPFCRKGPNAARRAKKMGYENVKVMSAGIKGWVSAGLATEADK